MKLQEICDLGAGVSILLHLILWMIKIKKGDCYATGAVCGIDNVTIAVASIITAVVKAAATPVLLVAEVLAVVSDNLLGVNSVGSAV